jgi:hypothetical protein
VPLVCALLTSLSCYCRVDDKSTSAVASRNKVSIDRSAKIGTGSRKDGNTRKRSDDVDNVFDDTMET